MNYEIRLVDLNISERQDIIDWARSNCPSFRAMFCYETEFLRDEGNFEFVFENEKDATLFGLKFGSH